MKKTAKLIALLLCVVITLTSCAPLIPFIMGGTDIGSHDNGPSNNGSSTPDYNGGSSNNGGSSSSTTNSIKKEVQDKMDSLNTIYPDDNDNELIGRIIGVLNQVTIKYPIWDGNTLTVNETIRSDMDEMELKSLEGYMDDNGAQYMKMDLYDLRNGESFYDVMRYYEAGSIYFIIGGTKYKYN